jgi:hypothetical protein
MSHVLRIAHSDGVAAVAKRSFKRAACHVYVTEAHVWYQLDLAGERPRRELPEEVRLLRAGDEALGGAVEMGQRIDEVRLRRAQGNDLWLAADDGGPLFRCWIYRRRAPVLAAPGGWLELPQGTVCLEDSATTARARGRGIAPGSWTAIADSLQAEGLAKMITKVGVDNEASRRAVVKSGFREIGVMRLVKTGPRKRTSFEAPESDAGSELALRLVG